MSKKTPFTVENAYAIETPEDNTRLYGVWAETYDEDFVAASGYVAYRHVIDQLLKHRVVCRPSGGRLSHETSRRWFLLTTS